MKAIRFGLEGVRNSRYSICLKCDSIWSFLGGLLRCWTASFIAGLSHTYWRWRARRRWRWRRAWRRTGRRGRATSTTMPTPFIPGSRSAPTAFLLTWGFDCKSIALYFLIMHLFDCILCVIVILELLSYDDFTMKVYGPLYCTHIILPKGLNQFLRSSFVIDLPYPFTYISGLRLFPISYI